MSKPRAFGRRLGQDHDHSKGGEGGDDLSPSSIMIAKELGLPLYDDVSNGPQTQGQVVYATGNGNDSEGVYRHSGSSYHPLTQWREDGKGNIIPVEGETVGDGITTANHESINTDELTVVQSIVDASGTTHTTELAESSDVSPIQSSSDVDHDSTTGGTTGNPHADSASLNDVSPIQSSSDIDHQLTTNRTHDGDAISPNTLNGADIANATSGEVPQSDGAGNLSMGSVGGGGKWEVDGSFNASSDNAIEYVFSSSNFNFARVYVNEFTPEGTNSVSPSIRVNDVSTADYAYIRRGGSSESGVTDWRMSDFDNVSPNEYASFAFRLSNSLNTVAFTVISPCHDPGTGSMDGSIEEGTVLNGDDLFRFQIRAGESAFSCTGVVEVL